MIESVPNFSEGRDEATIERLAAVVEASPGARLLDRSADADHNRSVLTLVGEPAAAIEALLAAARVAVERIDLRSHGGAHPRMGALDVAPFVPLENGSMSACVEAARRFAKRLWTELRVPSYFYGEAALRDDRRRLENVRRGGFEALLAATPGDPDRRPDVGGPAPHPTAGATAVGVRKPLIAFNVNLRTADLAVARRIARSVRESSGGLPSVKALGLALESRGLAQVSMNLTDYEVVPPRRVFERIEREAAAFGVEVEESELIGLIPAAALAPGDPERLRIRNFDDSRVLENRIRALA